MERITITPHIEYIAPDNALSRFLCSGMMVRGKATLFFDTNVGEYETRRLLRVEKPDFAVISHYHLDHSSWGPFVSEDSDAVLFVPSLEGDYLSDLDYFLEKTKGDGPSAGLWETFVRENITYRPIERFNPYDGSLKLDIGGVKMAFVPVPGHSPGHTAVYFQEEGILFTSDLGLGPFRPWYGFKDCRIGQYVDSLLRLKSLKPKLLLTSHSGVIRQDIPQVFDQCIKAFFETEAMIRRKLEKGLSKETIVQEGVYFKTRTKISGPLKHFLSMWDGVMFDHHVRKLEEGGLTREFPHL